MSKYVYRIMHLPIKRYLKWWLDKMASIEQFIVGYSNENPATLINCLKAPFISFKLGGRTVQGENVEGINKFSGWIKGKGINSTTGIEENDNQSGVSDYIQVDFKANPNYYISGLTDTLTSFIGAYNSSKQFLGRTSGSARTEASLTSSSFTGGTAQGTGDIAYLRVKQYQSGTSTGTINDLDNLQTQLQTGSTATPYVPYNCIQIKKCNKNILSPLLEYGTINSTTGENQEVSNTIRTKGFIDISSSNTWTFSRKNNAQNCKVRYYDKDFNYIGYSPAISDVLTRTLTVLENAKYLRFTLDNTNLNYITDYKVQIEEGSTATNYVAHEEKTYNFPLSEGQTLAENEYIDKNGIHLSELIPFTQEQQAVYDEIINDGTYKEVTHIEATASLNPLMEIEYKQKAGE